jgi:hypothetical protein
LQAFAQLRDAVNVQMTHTPAMWTMTPSVSNGLGTNYARSITDQRTGQLGNGENRKTGRTASSYGIHR